MPNIQIDELHELVCCACKLAGGIRCEALLQPQEGQRIADILFPDDRTIVEVKSLTVDRDELRSARLSLGKKYKEWADRGEVPPITGEARVRVGDLPRPLALELMAIQGKRIRAELTHANAQIRQTAARMDWQDSKGLVVFVTPAHFSTSAEIIGSICTQALQNASLRSINGVAIFETWTKPDSSPARMMMMRPVTSVGRIPPSIELIHNIGFQFAGLTERITKAQHVVFLLD